MPFSLVERLEDSLVLTDNETCVAWSQGSVGGRDGTEPVYQAMSKSIKYRQKAQCSAPAVLLLSWFFPNPGKSHLEEQPSVCAILSSGKIRRLVGICLGKETCVASLGPRAP